MCFKDAYTFQKPPLNEMLWEYLEFFYCLSGSNVIPMVLRRVVSGPAPCEDIYRNKDVNYLGSFAVNVHNATYFQA